MLEWLALAFAVIALLLALALFCYAMAYLAASAAFQKFNEWWKYRFTRRGIRVPGYHAALALGLAIIPQALAVALKLWEVAAYLFPLTIFLAAYLSVRGWNNRGNAQPSALKFAKIFYEPAYYFAGLAAGATKIVEWGPVFAPQKIALLW